MAQGFQILHLDSGREMRGGQWQVLQLMQELRAQGVSQALLTPAGSPLFERSSAAGFDPRHFSLAGLWRASRSADLLHAHDARSHTVAAVANRKPLVVSRRVAFPVGNSFASRWKYGRAAQYLAVSDFVKRQLMAAGVAEQEVTTVFDGVQIPASPATGTFVTALHSSDPGKGNRLITQAAKLAGVQVRFSNDLQRDLPQTAIFVYVSDSEGLGSAALLASAYGIPVIASSIGGLPEAVEDRVTGLLIENDPRQIVNALQALIGDSALAQRLGCQGRERMKQRFTMEHTASATLRVYRQVLGC